MSVRCLIIKYPTHKGLFVLSAQFGAVQHCSRGFFDIHFTTELPPAPKGADVRALRKGNALGKFRARVSSESPMGHQKSLGNFSPLFLTEKA